MVQHTPFSPTELASRVKMLMPNHISLLVLTTALTTSNMKYLS